MAKADKKSHLFFWVCTCSFSSVTECVVVEMAQVIALPIHFKCCPSSHWIKRPKQ